MKVRTVAKVMALLLIGSGSRAVQAQTQDEIQQLKKTIADLQKRLETLEANQRSAAESKAKAPRSVDAGFGKIKFNGLIQNRLVSDTGTGAHESFQFRRIELMFNGEINERIAWGVKVDPAKRLTVAAGAVNPRTNILQDAFVTYKLNPRWALEVGQQKIPVGLEGLQSSAQIDTVERALFMTGNRNAGLGFGDVRDTGLQLKGKHKTWDVALGLLNDSGESQNASDNNDQKDVAGRFVFRPEGIPGLQIGVSGLTGGTTPAPGGPSLTRDRLGAELLYKKEGWTFKSEYMTGTDQAVAGGPEFDRVGWYVHLGKQINPKWEAIARYDTWDPDEIGKVGGVNPEERDTILGVNYLLDSFHAKLQLNWLHKDFDGAEDRDQILVNAQTAW